MRSSSEEINISASAQRIAVDNRIPLRTYYRIADNLLKQADIYREEKNMIDLYVMLLRFSSLLCETIPKHRDYFASPPSERSYFQKRLLIALSELEAVKPDVQQRLIDRKNSRNQDNLWGQTQHNGFVNNSLEWPSVNKQTPRQNGYSQVQVVVKRDNLSQGPIIQHGKLPQVKPRQEQFQSLSSKVLRPKEETLSRHSILGPHGLHGRWQPPIIDRGIQYPSNLDLTPVEIPSLLQSTQDKPGSVKDSDAAEKERSMLEEVLSLQVDKVTLHEEQRPMITLDVPETPTKMDLIREPSPPPVRAEVQDVAAITSQVSNFAPAQTMSLEDELIQTESPLEVHISTTLMDSFMRLAKSNTVKNLETCGVLAGSLKNRKFHVTALIIPKQESTSDSCQTTNEEEIFDYQDKQSLFPLGWIHTHPTQSCFMSSIDVHTHYSYQTMLPEAIAIVMAPQDSSRTHGIFRLTVPGGMSVIRHCQQRGFHPHQQPSDGGPIYDHCSDVYMNPNLKCDVVDLR